MDSDKEIQGPEILIEREWHKQYDEQDWADDAEIKGYR